MRTAVDVVIAAPLGNVWQALTVPAEVEQWAGVTAAAVPDDYPQPGQYASWHDRGVLLHDYIVDVKPRRLLASRLTRASAMAIEHYHLRARGHAATRLRATWRGHPDLADNTALMRSLRKWVLLEFHSGRVPQGHVQNR